MAAVAGCGVGRWVGMRAQVRPLLEAMGRDVVDLGDDPATAAAAKLVGNFMIISQASLPAGFLKCRDPDSPQAMVIRLGRVATRTCCQPTVHKLVVTGSEYPIQE